MTAPSASSGTSGPAWLGIGAQRCGTSWFTRLLLQHPEVGLGTNGRKEQHLLSTPLAHGWDASPRERYLALFPDDALRGEFTPAYLRALWAVDLVAEVVRPDAPIIAILRDPVERFASAMRFYVARRDFPTADQPARLQRWASSFGTMSQWAGMYATQLDVWAHRFGRDRLVVLQYERALRDPQAATDEVWSRLGLRSVTLTSVHEPVNTTAIGVWDWRRAPGLEDRLRELYRPEVERLLPWGIDPALWPNFS